ncbi:hypothetical protein CHUAL_004201 [Chamberlinius hualienensis]
MFGPILLLISAIFCTTIEPYALNEALFVQRDLSHDTSGAPVGNGRSCKFNDDCVSGCCLAEARKERICAPLSNLGERCETGQIKGGYYPDYCPCKSKNAICQAESDGITKFCV